MFRQQKDIGIQPEQITPGKSKMEPERRGLVDTYSLRLGFPFGTNRVKAVEGWLIKNITRSLLLGYQQSCWEVTTDNSSVDSCKASMIVTGDHGPFMCHIHAKL